MYRLPQVILILFGFLTVLAQSPHGIELKMDCAQCHNPEGWAINLNTIKFRHSITDFVLEGAHSQTNCIDCHKSMVLSEVPKQCASCHDDMHSSTVGNDCARCHTSKTWLIDDIPELHEENGFPLIGVHSTLSCVDCHLSESNLRYDRIGNECINCHQDDYNNTQSPDHAGSAYSTNCIECHSTLGTGWETELADHNFFPLTLGHDIQDCTQCHTSGSYSGLSTECISCHQDNYNNTTNPDHSSVGYSTDCASCHTINPDWTPAIVDHDFFPLTLGHDIQDCNQCHTSGSYSGLSTECVSCHQNDYNNSTDPDHQDAGFSTDCVTCHTTNPNWTPTSWDHNDIYPLNGAHANIANDCTACHSGGYSNTPNTCASCHQDEYNNTTDPNHKSAQFPTDCIECHNESAWTPASFDHDGQYFPIYNGKHKDEWNSCTDCHTNTNNYAVFTCLTCHTSSETNNDHKDVSGYVYESGACLQCHPNGED